MFTLFYVAAEMWGDVVLSLLFWGLANEMTSLQEAPLLYPLFGVGANIGQTVSGKALSTFSAFAEHRMSYATQLQVRALLYQTCLLLHLVHASHLRFTAEGIHRIDLKAMPHSGKLPIALRHVGCRRV